MAKVMPAEFHWQVADHEPADIADITAEAALLEGAFDLGKVARAGLEAIKEPTDHVLLTGKPSQLDRTR